MIQGAQPCHPQSSNPNNINVVESYSTFQLGTLLENSEAVIWRASDPLACEEYTQKDSVTSESQSGEVDS